MSVNTRELGDQIAENVSKGAVDRLQLPGDGLAATSSSGAVQAPQVPVDGHQVGPAPPEHDRAGAGQEAAEQAACSPSSLSQGQEQQEGSNEKQPADQNVALSGRKGEDRPGSVPDAEGSAAGVSSQMPDAQQPQAEGQQFEGQQQEQQEQQGQESEQGEDKSPLSDAEALTLAESYKREGNELFGQGLWDEASAKYDAALDSAPESAHKEQAIYFANLAACNIKTQQYAAAVQNCTEAVQLDPSYQKAYMRRCEAYERLDELDHALADAKKLLELSPDSAWAKGKVAALQPIVDERAEKLKTEMFSKLKELGDSILGKFGLSTDNFKFDKDPATGGYNIKFQR